MKKLKGFIVKEFFHIFRDYRTILILFGMPIMQIMLFGFAITNEIKNAKIAVLDHSKDELSRKLIEKISASEYFTLYTNLQNVDEMKTAFEEAKIKQAIIIEKGFAENLHKTNQANIQIISDATEPNTANTLSNYTQVVIRNFQQDLNKQQKSGVMQIDAEVQMRYNEKLKGVFLFVPGLITIILMLVSAMMTSISITKEKEMGTMEILLVSPLKPFQLILAKVIPYLLLSFLNACIILILGNYVFGVPVKGNLILLLVESMLFIITALSLGIFISTKTDSQQVALMVSLMGLMLPTIMLSGFIFPIENMPLPLQIISNFLPAKWFIIIVKSIMLKGSSFIYVWKETLILLGFTTLFIGLSVKNFKIRLA
ncbi:ABC transporter permease [Chondrinema litorale]|uniref:ABC transporter permease n=1 Tax=Chondrinema litorale TaxID=2994555 RepID=UPI002543D4CB|nr:ABC transporter permease [Chondrinema litorale]UZR93711.1 ABC transporter permease [Chondrinema litorale]